MVSSQRPQSLMLVLELKVGIGYEVEVGSMDHNSIPPLSVVKASKLSGKRKSHLWSARSFIYTRRVTTPL